MCGIAGIVGGGATGPTTAAIEAMVACIAYRGPDGVGTERIEEDRVVLGHRRLSILDLSTAGRQPMWSRSGRFCMVFNGEIYNYLELRAELVSLGFQFVSHSDTEVLLGAFEQWGVACLQKLIGMYAFAIWDRESKELVAARDRLGIKPFYYSETPDGLIFASEIKSILAVKPGPLRVETSLIDAFMDFGYVPGALSLHKGVKRLLPGQILRWRDGRTAISSYWELEFRPSESTSVEEQTARLSEMLKDSVDLHLRSDVPLGVFLSGGLDSSAVVALLSPSASSGLKTFSFAYDFGPNYDETPFARQVARQFSTDHHEVRLTPAGFRDLVPSFIWHMDEPVTEAAAVSLYCVSKLAREHVVVCLSGEGSDELFAGYDFYNYNLAIEKVRTIPGLPGVSRAGAMLARAANAHKLAKYLDMAGRPLEERYKGISSYETRRKQLLYTPGFARNAREGNSDTSSFIEKLFERTKTWDPLDRMLYFDTKTWLVDDLLIKADRMSMAASIELRVPFLDHRLVEFAATLPRSQKAHGNTTKVILKRAMEGKLPEHIIRRKKMGFPAPLEVMFRGELYDYAHDLLLSEAAVGRGYFDRSRVRSLLEEHRLGRAANHREIWQLVVLEEWHRRFSY